MQVTKESRMESMPVFGFAILVDVPMFKQNAKTFCSMLKHEETSAF
jgi:hypothetical protein